MKNFYRHGDLSFHSIAKPQNLKEEKFNGEFILALGEATGHAHRLKADPKEVKLFRDFDGSLILQIDGKAILDHEEHKTIELAPGWYKMNNEREFNYWEMETQKVQD